MKLRCGNLEDVNKYWLKDKEKRCRCCKMGRDILEHYVGDCKVASIQFENLGKNMKAICDDKYSTENGKVLNKLWKKREESMKGKKKEMRNEVDESE